MVKSATHLLQAAPGVRLWLAKELVGSEDVALWLAEGENLLEQRADAADTVIGGGRGAARRVMLGGDRAGVWRINRHGGLLGGVQGDRYRTPARLQAEVELSEELRRHGIDTPRVLLALAVKHGLSWRQHLVTTEVDGAVTVFDARDQQPALQAADQLLDRLCEVGLWATDLHPANMLWQAGPVGEPGHGQSGRCWVIDLAGAKLLAGPLTAEQRLARRKRFARYFAKHGGEIPARFALED